MDKKIKAFLGPKLAPSLRRIFRVRGISGQQSPRPQKPHWGRSKKSSTGKTVPLSFLGLSLKENLELPKKKEGKCCSEGEWVKAARKEVQSMLPGLSPPPFLNCAQLPDLLSCWLLTLSSVLENYPLPSGTIREVMHFSVWLPQPRGAKGSSPCLMVRQFLVPFILQSSLWNQAGARLQLDTHLCWASFQTFPTPLVLLRFTWRYSFTKSPAEEFLL